MPTHLRPTAPIAADAVLVGDPGRALLLAQELLVEPKMSNHARGLWGYTGQTAAGHQLTIQSTGIGGPSAALVLAELAELGVGRIVRVGTCTALGEGLRVGRLLLATAAIVGGGSATALGADLGERLAPSAGLTRRLGTALGAGGQPAVIVSLDTPPPTDAPDSDALAADMQTAPLLAQARALGVESAAVLVVGEDALGGQLNVEELASCERAAGQAAMAILSG